MSQIGRRIWRSGGPYLLWLVSTALGVADLLVARTLLRAVAFRLDADRWTLPTIEKFGFVALGLAWLALVYICEALYQKDAAVSTSRLVRRFAWVTGVQIGFLILANLALWLMLW
ncbi:MAG: hypothetical protein RML36_15140 [Anaerolineae bacterium]|nr:hypothetical protein [Anaerolineae bacterium]MDW8100806.1 hypothetical protein [Anaerolineae bacterium]